MWSDPGGPMPSVKVLMTPFPHTIGAEASVEEALALFQKLGVHHLPVEEAGELVGILSSRDLERQVNPALAPDERRSIRVGSLCVRDGLLLCDADAPLDQVLLELAERKVGSALVTRRGDLVGIFTIHDACIGLARLLRRLHPEPTEDEAG